MSPGWNSRGEDSWGEPRTREPFLWAPTRRKFMQIQEDQPGIYAKRSTRPRLRMRIRECKFEVERTELLFLARVKARALPAIREI